jgi:hypothetical protein
MSVLTRTGVRQKDCQNLNGKKQMSILNYPGFSKLPKPVKRRLVTSETLFFDSAVPKRKFKRKATVHLGARSRRPRLQFPETN